MMHRATPFSDGLDFPRLPDDDAFFGEKRNGIRLQKISKISSFTDLAQAMLDISLEKLKFAQSHNDSPFTNLDKIVRYRLWKNN